MRSLAFDSPMRRVRRWVPPAPGIIPSLVSVKPIFVTAKPEFQNKRYGDVWELRRGRRPTSDTQITGECHLEAAPQSWPIYGSNGWEWKSLETTERPPEIEEEFVDLRLCH